MVEQHEGHKPMYLIKSSPLRLWKKLSGILAAKPLRRDEDLSEEIWIRCNAHLGLGHIHVSLRLLGFFLVNITTSSRRRREGHTVCIDFVCVFLDLLLGDAVLEDDDEGCGSTGLVSVVHLMHNE